MPQTLQQTAEREVVSTWLPAHEAAALRARAATADRSIAAEIRRALRPYFNDEAPAGQDEGFGNTVEQDRHARP